MTPNKPYVKEYVRLKDGTLEISNPIEINNPFINNNHLNRKKKRDSFKYIILNGMQLKVGGNNRKPCKRTGKSRIEHLLN